MKTKTTFTLFVFACILTGMIWLMREHKPNAVTVAAKLIPVEINNITSWTLAQSSFEIECSRAGGDWAITKPFKARASAAAIDRIMQTLADLQLVETITAEQRIRRGLVLDDYGVGEKPKSRLTLVTAHTNLTLLLGRDALDDVLYARFAGADTVLTTTSAIAGVLPQHIDELRDRNLIRSEVATISRLEITRPSSGFMQASRKDGMWLMQQPVKAARLSKEKITKALKMLHDSQAARFITGIDNGKSGLDDAQGLLRIAIWNGDDTAGEQLLLGKDVPENKNEVYAKLSGGDSIFTVKKDIFDAFNVRASDFRDATVFPISPVDMMSVSLRDGERKLEFLKNAEDWLITEPRRIKTDSLVMNELLAKLCILQVEEFVETPELLPAIGLDPPARSIEVSTARLTETGTAGTQKHDPALHRVLLIGKEVADNRGFYCRFENESSVVRIGREPMASILNGRYSSLPIPVSGVTNDAAGGIWINPLLYSKRTMLELERESIVAISLRKEGREQAVFKDETGSWIPVPPLTGKVKVDVLRDILTAVSSLEAKEIRCQGNENPVSYGLDDTSARLTFGLADSKGIRKTLLIGYRAGSDGVYATIQGMDVIFVLPITLVGKLLRDIIPEEEHGG